MRTCHNRLGREGKSSLKAGRGLDRRACLAVVEVRGSGGVWRPSDFVSRREVLDCNELQQTCAVCCGFDAGGGALAALGGRCQVREIVGDGETGGGAWAGAAGQLSRWVKRSGVCRQRGQRHRLPCGLTILPQFRRGAVDPQFSKKTRALRSLEVGR